MSKKWVKLCLNSVLNQKTNYLALTNIQGRYVVFVDANDYLELDFCERMVDVLQESNVDVIFWENSLIFEN